MLHNIIEALLSFFGSLSYTDIFFLMTLESSIVPVPSELVMIPAGSLVQLGELNPFLAILAGGLGSVMGALLNYWILGRWIGKPFLEKYGKYILITREKYNRAETLFLTNQKLYTFLGRFIPVVRHLISIPAGIFRMRMALFMSLTFLGAVCWCSILVTLGYYFGKPILAVAKEYIHTITLIAVPLVALYVRWKIWKKRK